MAERARRHDVSDAVWALLGPLAWAKRTMGRNCQGQPAIHQCGVLDFAYTQADELIADKGYDSDAIIEKATAQGMQAVIPPRKNRKEQRSYDKHLYRHRHRPDSLSRTMAQNLMTTLSKKRPIKQV